MKQVTVLFLITFFFGPHWISMTMATWMDTFLKCPNGLEFDKNVLAKNTEFHGQVFWIGSIVNETVTKTWVEIQGCYKLDRMDEQFSSPLLDLCSFDCSSSVYVGYINKTKQCICLGTENPRTKRNITLCATEDNCSNYVIIYKRTSEIQIEPSINSGTCITAKCLNGTAYFKQTSCFSSGNQTKCNVGDNNITLTNSLDECIRRRHTLPVSLKSFNDTCTTSNDTTYYWTNIISVKSYIQRYIHKAASFDTSLLYCASGFILDTNNRSVLQIRHHNCSDHLNSSVGVCRISDNSTLIAKGTLQTSSTSIVGIIAGCLSGFIVAVAVIIGLVCRKRPICTYKTSSNSEVPLNELSNAVCETSTAETASLKSSTLVSDTKENTSSELYTNPTIFRYDETNASYSDYEDYDHLHQKEDIIIEPKIDTYDSSYCISKVDPAYNTLERECRQFKNDMYDHI